jgi:hypothetical protein
MRPAGSVLLACVVCLASLPAFAEKPAPQDPPAAGADADEPAETEPLPEPAASPPAPDSLGGHVLVSGGATWVVPFGLLQSGLAQTRVMSSGIGADLGIATGISRNLAVGLWGQGAWFGGGRDCSTCSTSSFAVGPLLRYHLVQGVRFDPWLSAGFGYRATSVSARGQHFAYSGMDLLRLELGGDWYPAKNLGIGPVLDLGAGTYASRPDSVTCRACRTSRGLRRRTRRTAQPRRGWRCLRW